MDKHKEMSFNCYLGLFACVIAVTQARGLIQDCLARKYDSDSTVCVCNEEHCDTLPAVGNFQAGHVQVYESGQSGRRLIKSTVEFNRTSSMKSISEVITVTVNSTIKFQSIIGFGAAFTDAAGINVATLPESLQDTLIKSYFTEQGSEYNIGRIPIASTDFSTREYSYADVKNDFDLENFQLAEEDTNFKIPYILKAIAVSSKEIYFFGSPWSSPAWMKTTERMKGRGTLKDSPDRKYHKTWAKYFVRFLQEYEKQNITLWGLTVQNEPMDGLFPWFPFQAMGFTGPTEMEFVAQELGPTLQKAGYGVEKIKLMIFDDMRIYLKLFVDEVLKNDTAAKYVSGIAFHWYTNSLSPVRTMDEVHEAYPDRFLLASEACEGTQPSEFFRKVSLGDWGRAENYAKDILQDLNHWSVGWVDWNLALDLKGGPNLVRNFADSPIIVNATGREFYKQPMYYSLAHFSKFLPRGTVRISLDTNNTSPDIDVGSFLRPDGATVVIVLNRKSSDVGLEISDPRQGVVQYVLPSRSMQSYIWK